MVVQSGDGWLLEKASMELGLLPICIEGLFVQGQQCARAN